MTIEVTAGIHAYNAAETIAQTIESIRAQSYAAIAEILVADDGSTDETADIAEALGCRVIRLDHVGRAGAFNAVWQNCRTSHVFYVGADDWIGPRCIASHVAAWEPGLWYTYGSIALMDRFGEPRGSMWQYATLSREQMLEDSRRTGQGSIPTNASVLWSVDHLERIGGARAAICTDFEMSIRAAQEHRDFAVKAVAGPPMYFYRWSPDRLLGAEKALVQSSIMARLLSTLPEVIAKWLHFRGQLDALAFLERARQIDPEATATIERKVTRTDGTCVAALALDQDGGDAFLRPLAIRWAKRWDVAGIRLDDVDPDLIFVEWCAGTLARLSQAPKGHRLIARLHSYEALTDLPAAVHWPAVDALAFVSRKVESIFLDRFAASVPTVWMPNGVDLDRYRIPQGKRHDTRKIAVIASMSHKKGPMLLCQVMAALPDGYTVHIAGTWPEPRFDLYVREFVEKQGLAGRVEFCGHVENVAAWLGDKSFILATSPFESWGAGIAEAVACGCLPLIHDWPGAEEWWGFVERWRTVPECIAMIEKPEFPDRMRESLPSLDDARDQSEAILAESLARPIHAPFVLTPRDRFLEDHEVSDLVETKRRAHRKPAGIERVLVHMPPNGGFRYIQQNYALAFEALGYDVRVWPMGEAIPDADLLLTAWSDPFIEDLYLWDEWPDVIMAAAGAFRDCAEIVSPEHTPREGFHYWTPVTTLPERDDYPNLHHLPYAAMPTWHRFVNGRIESDLAFIGTRNSAKGDPFNAWLAPIINRHPTQLHGVGFGDHVKPLPQNQAGRVYSSSRVCLNVHQDRQRDPASRPMLNERAFVIPACGGCQVTDAVPVVGDYFEPDVEIVVADDPGHMIECVVGLLRDARARRKIALAGHARVLADHTYMDRVTEMMTWLA